jgi:hypothetical protein
MTAETLGERLGEILGNPLPRQTVYLLEQGGRRLAAEEVVALAIVLDVSVAELFTPWGDVDQVQVGERSYPRERLLVLGEKDAAWAYEIARHAQAIRRATRDIRNAASAQDFILDSIERVIIGQPQEDFPTPDKEAPVGERILAKMMRQNYEHAQTYYAEPEGQGE